MNIRVQNLEMMLFYDAFVLSRFYIFLLDSQKYEFT